MNQPDLPTPPPPNHARSLLSLLEISSLSKVVLFLVTLVIAGIVSWVIPESSGLEPAARRALFILIFAAGLWITDAVPAFAVGILILGLQIALLGRPGGVFAESPHDWEQFVSVLGHPLVWLFFGGFVLAAGMSKTSLDLFLAQKLIMRPNTTPAKLVFSVTVTTFFLSMFISNTATTAMVLAMLNPIWSRGKDARFITGLVLSVSLGANLGGMASLIGTPPNAIAVGSLQQATSPITISFLQWILLGLPPGLLLLGILSFYIKHQYLKHISEMGASADLLPDLTQENSSIHVVRWQRWTVTGTCILTVLLWMTGQWHGIPTAVVSFFPIVIFTTSGVLTANDVRGLQYDVLFLLAGGLALGQTITMTGLSDWLVSHIPTDYFSSFSLILLLSYLTVLMSNFMSNTAASNILIPLGITLASTGELTAAVSIALAASAAMCLPVATPPNAMVYATEKCSSRDFLKIGLLIGLLAPPISTIWVRFISQLSIYN